MAQRNAGIPEPFPAARGGPLDDGRQREAAVTIARPALTKVSADSAESPQKIPLFQFPIFLGMLGIARFHGALACLIFPSREVPLFLAMVECKECGAKISDNPSRRAQRGNRRFEMPNWHLKGRGPAQPALLRCQIPN